FVGRPAVRASARRRSRSTAEARHAGQSSRCRRTSAPRASSSSILTYVSRRRRTLTQAGSVGLNVLMLLTSDAVRRAQPFRGGRVEHPSAAVFRSGVRLFPRGLFRNKEAHGGDKFAGRKR